MTERLDPKIRLAANAATIINGLHSEPVSIGEEGLHLPPRHLWLSTRKIETPVDRNGLVVIPKLVTEVKALVDPSYTWPLGRLDVHHFYYYDRLYKSPFAPTNALRFRELRPHKGLLPIGFHGWLHMCTLPPAMPSKEVMQERIDFCDAAQSLFNNAREILRIVRGMRRRHGAVLEGRTILPPQYCNEDRAGRLEMRRIFERNFRGMVLHNDKLWRVAPEFRLAEPADDVEKLVGDVAQLSEFAERLGRLVVPPAVKLQYSVAP